MSARDPPPLLTPHLSACPTLLFLDELLVSGIKAHVGKVADDAVQHSCTTAERERIRSKREKAEVRREKQKKVRGENSCVQQDRAREKVRERQKLCKEKGRDSSKNSEVQQYIF